MFILQKSIERKIDHRFKQIEVAQKLHFEEAHRRQSKLFDEQFKIRKGIGRQPFVFNADQHDLFEIGQILHCPVMIAFALDLQPEAKAVDEK